MVKIQRVKVLGFYKDDGENKNSENTGIFSLVNPSPPHTEGLLCLTTYSYFHPCFYSTLGIYSSGTKMT